MSVSDEINEITPQQAIKEAVQHRLIVEPRQMIGSGKEAFVIWAIDEDGREVALKSYRIYRSTHREVINNTPRTSPYAIITNFARREYWKAMAINKLNIPSPEPYLVGGYSFTMQMLGDEEGPFPLLGNIGKSAIDDPVDVLEQCIDILHSMFLNRFVHGDFSEHNLLFDGETVFVIDFLQTERFALKDAVHSASPLMKLSEAFPILKNDVSALLTYFKRSFRIRVNQDEIIDYIIGDYKKKILQVFEHAKESNFSEHNQIP